MTDYKKLYEEALERARLSRQQLLDIGEEATEIEHIFPELSSEDEKIRKELINYFADFHLQTFAGIDPKKILAWLEKQGEKLPVGFYYVDSEGKKFYSDTLKYGDVTVHVEKQVEQKETLCDKCRKEQPSHSCQDITALGRCYIEGMNTSNKVEPKFKAGDWVIYNNGNTYQVEEISDKRYELIDNFGDELSVPMCWEKSLRLWTIQDAKDGDVLCAKGNYFKEYIFNFSSLTEDDVISTHFGYDVFRGTFDTKLSRFGREEEFMSLTPATKEQRDLLFSKMKEAGYEWNTDKKKLKQLSQSKVTKISEQVWSEEDEEMIDEMIYFIKEYQQSNRCIDENGMQNSVSCENWLKLLKDRI